MGLSNLIEEFIKDLILAQDGEIELKRNELAGKFNCVPSQINYVISTRFSPERGYIVESRRGGGGYIRITKITPDEGNRVMHIVSLVGESISYSNTKALVQSLYDYKIISKVEARIILAALSDNSLIIKQPERDMVRAKALKNILVNVCK